MGSPHIHVAHRMVRSLAKMARVELHKKILLAWLAAAAKNRKMMQEKFRACRAKEAWREASRTTGATMRMRTSSGCTSASSLCCVRAPVSIQGLVGAAPWLASVLPRDP